MDFAVYDRRTLRLRWGLAICLTVSLAIWYLTDFHPELFAVANPQWLGRCMMLASTAAIGLYANSLIGELRLHAHDLFRQGESARDFAQRDQLTGAFNRAAFIDVLSARVREAKSGAPVALFLLDLDRFKNMNDVFGHAFGDAVLKRVGDVLAREAGIDNIGRLGGDEFAFMLTGAVSQSTCQAVGVRIIRALAEPISIQNRTTQIEASIGVAWSPEHDTDRLDLMGCADLALYQAKEDGRGRVACFDGKVMKEERYRRSIERELRGAILMNELDVHYQPILDIAETRVRSLEALVRWKHPVRGMIAPADFIPVAERSSLIEMLGNWVFARVCEDARRWPDLEVGINVSPAQLRRPEFIEMVRETIRRSGCNPRNIAIEITEGLLMDCSGSQVTHLQALKEMGISLWLDDFGAGHSGLSYLRDFPIDVIKIDKSFVQDMRSSHANRVFVSTIAQMGHGLDRLVVAEGVETEEDLVLVRAAGCSHVQGFHFAKPMAANMIDSYVRSRRESRAA